MSKLSSGSRGFLALTLVLGLALAVTQLVLPAQAAPIGFTVSPQVPLPGQPATFTATDTRPMDVITWDFENDGTFDATGSTVQNVYATPGQKTVVMRVTHREEVKDVVKVIRVDAPPSASFTVTPGVVDPGQTVSFDASASSDPDGAIVKYEWDLDGNGTFETVTNATPTTSKAYSEGGTVTARLRVTDNDGATAVTTSNVVVNRRPIARVSASPNPALVGQSVTFDASASSDPDGTIMGYEWDLDDDSQFDDGTDSTASHSFGAAGAHTVRVRVTDNRGSKDTATVVVTVTGSTPNQPPLAAFGATPNPAATGQTVQFNASASSDPDGTIASYQWDLDGNGTYELSTGTTPTTSKTYTESGTVAVKLRVTDNRGASAEKTVSLVIENRRPTASFTASPNPALVGQTVQFNASGSSDPDGTITGYAWDLDNDGQFDDATGVSPSHSFAVAGTHTVRLSVTDNRGATDTATVAVTVNSAPSAPVSPAPAAGRLGPVPSGLTVVPPRLTVMTPFPVVRIVGRATSSGARIRLLMVRGAPRGATATVRCRGSRCPRRAQSKQVRSGSVRFRAFERRLRAGVRIQVFVTQSNRIGKYTSFKIRKRRPPLRTDMCATSATATPGPCPSS